MDNFEADILILGYGPAGVSAALYGLRAGLDVLLVGKDGGALSKAHAIQNYYGLEKPLTGEELMQVGKKQALDLGAQIVDDEVMDLMFDGSQFVAKGLAASYHGKVCIMATGAARKKHPLPGMAEMEGHGVSYCAVCDSFFYKGKNVAVLGSGEYALHETDLGMSHDARNDGFNGRLRRFRLHQHFDLGIDGILGPACGPRSRRAGRVSG